MIDVCNTNGCILKRPIDIQHKTKRQLWKSIKKRLHKMCPTEACWIDLEFINNIQDKALVEKLKYFTFKPKMTKKRNSWLSTKDINEVMQQYQEFDSAFKFLGALPSDFWTQTRVHYNQFKLYKKIGIVFNLDTHDKPGSHWVAFLIDNKQKCYEYFDSTGKPPNKYIQGFIDVLKKNVVGGYTFLQNTKVHQRKNSECGIYSMYYIIQRLLGRQFHDISSHVINDDDMNKFRDFIFRPL